MSPNQEATPRRTVRVPDDLWEAVKRKARDEGRTVTEVVVWLLSRWVRGFYD